MKGAGKRQKIAPKKMKTRSSKRSRSPVEGSSTDNSQAEDNSAKNYKFLNHPSNQDILNPKITMIKIESAAGSEIDSNSVFESFSELLTDSTKKLNSKKNITPSNNLKNALTSIFATRSSTREVTEQGIQLKTQTTIGKKENDQVIDLDKVIDKE